jgi:hypothetical protein
MAIINDSYLVSQLQSILNNSNGRVDMDTIVSTLNHYLPASQQLSTQATTTGIYKRFATSDMVDGKVEVVTAGLWSGDAGSLTSVYTSSAQTASVSAQYYYNIYNKNPQSDSTAEVQYSVAYGHKYGSGSVSLQQSDTALLATKATYAQYAALLLDSGSTFTFTADDNLQEISNDIYVINIGRSQYRETMDAGNWSLTLSGSKGKFTFIDNSGKKFGDTFGKTGTVFDIASGSLNLGTQNDATVLNWYDNGNAQGYGKFFSDKAIIVLNPIAIGNTVGDIGTMGNLSGSLLTTSNRFNQKLLAQSINLGGDFQARRTENVKTTHYFVRVNNREFNYSNNPTYVDANGYFAERSFDTDPKTFITTIGLYNDYNELIAVAKTSQPIPKGFDKEVLLKIKLSF